MELSKKTDYFLIQQIKKNASDEAYLELKNRVQNSYFRTLSSYCKKVPQLKYDEMAEKIDEVVLKAAASYKKSKKTQFNSWFTNHSRYFILTSIKRLNELGYFVPTENLEIDLINNRNNKYHLDTREEFKDHIFSLLQTYPDKRAVEIFKLRYYSDKKTQKWSNIAAQMNLSVQQTMNVYNGAKKMLYKQMTRENNI